MNVYMDAEMIGLEVAVLYIISTNRKPYDYILYFSVEDVQLKGIQCRRGLLADKAVTVLKEFYAKGNPNGKDFIQNITLN